MDNAISNAWTAAVQSLDHFSVPAVETAIKDASEKVQAAETLTGERKEAFTKELTAFQEVAVKRFSDIDRQELFTTVSDVRNKVHEGNEKSYGEASQTMDTFVKKYGAAQ